MCNSPAAISCVNHQLRVLTYGPAVSTANTTTSTDPADDGNVTVANGYAAYPDGPARNPSSVQRGSVQFLSTYPGDPTTPGYPSIGEEIPRTGIDEVTPQIPSIPISMVDAEPILAALNGSGPSSEEVGRDNWIGVSHTVNETCDMKVACVADEDQYRDFKQTTLLARLLV